MKRGLVRYDAEETPPEEFRSRLDAVRAKLRRAGVDVGVIYGDVHRSDDIAWLTNLCIYWNEGVLAIPVDGEPALLAKLSPRVHPFMQRTSVLDDLRSGKDLASLVDTFGTDHGARVIGLVDAAEWPADVSSRLRATSSCDVVDLPGVVREVRARPSETDHVLLQKAARAMTTAFDRARRPGLTIGGRAGAAERELRDAGFKDVLTDIHRTRAGTVSLGIRGQYRNLWLQMGRVVEPTTQAEDRLVQVAETAHRDATAQISAGVAAGTVTDAIRGTVDELDGELTAQVRLVNHADLLRLPIDGATRIDDGAVVMLRVDVVSPSAGIVHLADSFLVHDDGATCLTSASLTEEVSA